MDDASAFPGLIQFRERVIIPFLLWK